MTVADTRFFSEALGTWTRYNMLLPDVGEGPYPILLQLHGLGGDCDSWVAWTNLVRYRPAVDRRAAGWRHLRL